ncbi:uncharacterized protein LY89DRAFT_67884 [Mollisia scopiformis]|uniref:Uncharacterized protein n=1 Tax=Mollisia scopiformis TaxID=149040 RepID=A0A194X9S6_MOLSC|nr:uncharacterized protein LY89DRAFT_67884 [Mollisia scopiformis]KUJ16930.1 hypothetical protein LY89DRAFT_67884 [Mollisia scopiformis]
MAVDIVSIVIAAVSLVGSLVSAGFTGWISFYIDQVKRRAEAKALVHKYRDPLLLAAMDLQSRIYGIVQASLLSFHADEEKRDLVFVYTSFLVGQYFSWTWILRRQAQFVRFSTDKQNRELSRLLETITDEIATDANAAEHPFMLWRGQQMAIGEMMTEKDGDELHCIGYSEFVRRYHTNEEFHNWFKPIERSLQDLVRARERHDPVATYRLRRLQHRLIDLITLLDAEGLGEGRDRRDKVHAATDCKCAGCPGRPKPKTPLLSLKQKSEVTSTTTES